MSKLASAIARALDGLRFGSVEITVHDGRVTLIERREKLRVNDGDAGPIGRPKDARAHGVNPYEEDPTGRPEVPLTERADATRNLDRSSWSNSDPDDGNGPRRPDGNAAASRRGGNGA